MLLASDAMSLTQAAQVIMRFENIVADLRSLQQTAWTRVAADEGLLFPRLEYHIYELPPQRAIMQARLLLSVHFQPVRSLPLGSLGQQPDRASVTGAAEAELDKCCRQLAALAILAVQLQSCQQLDSLAPAGAAVDAGPGRRAAPGLAGGRVPRAGAAVPHRAPPRCA